MDRPLRLSVELSQLSEGVFKAKCNEARESELADVIDLVAKDLGPGPHEDYNAFLFAVNDTAKSLGVKFSAKGRKLLSTELATKDESAEPVIKKKNRDGSIEFEVDSELRDTEQVPLLEEGGIQAFFDREVLPFVQDAWIDESKTSIGYEVSFTRYFYKPQPLRTLNEIRADIEALEKETEGLLEQVLVDTTTGD